MPGVRGRSIAVTAHLLCVAPSTVLNDTAKMVYHSTIWLRPDADTTTIIHEHLHARSSSKALDKYWANRPFEEGACELLAQELCKEKSITPSSSYNRYVEPLRKIAKLTSGYESEYSFAFDLFLVKMENRKQWLLNLAEKEGPITKLRIKRAVKEMEKGEVR